MYMCVYISLAAVKIEFVTSDRHSWPLHILLSPAIDVEGRGSYYIGTDTMYWCTRGKSGPILRTIFFSPQNIL